MDTELKTILEAIRADLNLFRSETDANLQAVKSHLNTLESGFSSLDRRLNSLEYGVLTIAQKLLAENEVHDIHSKMRPRAVG